MLKDLYQYKIETYSILRSGKKRTFLK